MSGRPESSATFCSVAFRHSLGQILLLHVRKLATRSRPFYAFYFIFVRNADSANRDRLYEIHNSRPIRLS